MKESITFRWVVFFVGFALMFVVFNYLLNFETVVAIIAAFAVSLCRLILVEKEKLILIKNEFENSDVR